MEDALDDSLRRALFGEQLRAFRVRNGWTIQKAAEVVKVSNAGALRQHEAGTRPLPKPWTINKIAEGYGLSYADRVLLLGLAGHLSPTPLPSKKEIFEVMIKVEREIAELPYPVTVVDYQFRYWMANGAMATLLGGTSLIEDIVLSEAMIFDVSFDSSLGIRSHFTDALAVEREQVARFCAYNTYRRHEPFYRLYPNCMSRLPQQDYERFVTIWTECNAGSPLRGHAIHAALSFGDEPNQLVFNLRSLELLQLDRLFMINYYEPRIDIAGNVERCSHIFAHSQKHTFFRAWDIHPNIWETV